MPREDWDDLRYVLAVAEEGTLSAAARRLGVNHATVLRRIAAYEAATGAALFDKTGRGYVLPPDRLRILEAAREVDRAVQTVARLMQGVRAPLTGDVRITSTDSFCQVLLPPILAQIALQAPDLTVTLLSSNTHVDMGKTVAEITVRPTTRLPDDLIGVHAANLGFSLFRAVTAVGDDGTAVATTPWLRLAGAMERTVPGRWMAENLRADQIGDGADSFLSLREMAAAGRGLAILPSYLGHGDTRLRPVLGQLPPMEVGIWVASHADLAHVPRIAQMRRMLSDGLAALAPMLSGGGRQG